LTAHDVNSVSAIVCNYNYGAFIGETLDSLARQTHLPDTLIVVDDGSDDSSRAVIEGFLGARGHLFARTHFIRNETNAGKLACLNKALAFVDTRFSIIVDSDDFIPDHAIQSLLASFADARRTEPEIGFVYSDSYLVDQGGAVISRGRSAEWSLARLATHSYIPECALTLSAALKAAAPFDETIRIGTKHHKWTRIAAAGWTGRYVAEPLFFYRMHDANMSGIGRSVLAEDDCTGRKDRLLSGYWAIAGSDEIAPD
jgi:glycosyltransferase involved in cell wall biosynthesis